MLSLVPGCRDDEAEPLRLSVRAEVLHPDAPVEVEAVMPNGWSEVGPGQDEGWYQHGVRVTWRGNGAARLDDARFVHRVEGEKGTLITLGRGCGWSFDEASDELVFPCTADLLLIVLQPGATHEYPVSVPSELDSVRLSRGTYVVEEVIGWRPASGGGTGGRFTVRVTYTVD